MTFLSSWFKDGDTVTRYGLNVAGAPLPLANWIGGQGDYNFFGDNEGGRTAPNDQWSPSVKTARCATS